MTVPTLTFSLNGRQIQIHGSDADVDAWLKNLAHLTPHQAQMLFYMAALAAAVANSYLLTSANRTPIPVPLDSGDTSKRPSWGR